MFLYNSQSHSNGMWYSDFNHWKLRIEDFIGAKYTVNIYIYIYNIDSISIPRIGLLFQNNPGLFFIPKFFQYNELYSIIIFEGCQYRDL